ncbi:cytidine deaminase [Orenia metallireducens]|jgi:cytidine deaminase|uniref:Cytidine deaminase n=1 Tax=Orenia metallireducens TaxID=1413210 RepID=A0A285F4W7_9FIRM|nr:cytidine deaminase [Orenia metallireducens]PRX34898.1 cytidine deaminase [Orenia metallireducens]SNY06103.1 cytidine deaminase [Orenia metallireducens]
MIKDKTKELVEKATEARKKAYVPYSNFKVGAALLTKDGEIYTGCNVENSSYGLSNCAERTAIFKAISEGEMEFEAIAIVADTKRACPPCGACRQVIVEFGKDIEVIMSNLDGDVIIKKADDLLWGSFSNQDLG